MATLTKEEILDGIAELSVIQLSELLKDFEERFGVTAAAPVAVAAAAAPAAGGDAGGAEEEKSEFDVILTAAGCSPEASAVSASAVSAVSTVSAGASVSA